MNTLALDNAIETAAVDTETGEIQRPTDASGNHIYRVPESNMEALKARVGKMNKRAAKLKMDPLVLAEVGEDFETVKKSEYDEETGRYHKSEYQVRIVLVTLAGNCPRVNGWAMAATIQHEEGGNILRTVPGFETMLPVQYRTNGTICEHCETNRIRKDTYVLQSETNGWKQVGRNCLADFLRTENASGLAEYAEMLANLDEELSGYEDEGFGGNGAGSHYFSAQALLTQVACCIRADGWCSRTEAKNSFSPKLATVDSALSCMDSKTFAKLSARDQEKLTPNDADEKRATDALAWAQELAADVSQDYLWNIRVISHKEFIGYREAGLAGSIISAYNRAMEQELARKYEKDHPSEWFGTDKERVTMALTVIGLRDIASEWGNTTLVTFRTESGDKAKWFASNTSGFEIDKTYIVKATIKGHDEYKGSKQTILTRCSIYDAEAEAKAKADSKIIKKVLKARYSCKHEVKYSYIDVPELNQYAQNRRWEENCCAECCAAWTARAEAEANGQAWEHRALAAELESYTAARTASESHTEAA